MTGAAVEAASEKEFFGWTGKHDMARAVRMAIEASWDGICR
jgi:hypothetical protein